MGQISMEKSQPNGSVLSGNQHYISYKDGVRRPTPTESERLQGFPTGWTIPLPTFTAPARGLDSERYHAAGNAVAVPVVRWSAERVAKNLKSKKKASGLSFDDFVAAWAPDLMKDTRKVDFLEVLKGVERGNYFYRWKSGGCAWGHQVIEGAASPAPSKIIKSRFVDILDADVPDERYFLTVNAAAGIVRRADIVGRTLFPPMRKALDRMIAADRGSPLSSIVQKDKDTTWRAQPLSV